MYEWLYSIEMTKYKEYVQKLLDENKIVFESFRKLHDAYALKQDKLQEEFNSQGEKVMELVHEYENRLCRQSEKGGYGVFSPKLSEKFQEELKKIFPFIDHIGLIVEKPATSPKDGFNLKKITLR